MKIFCFLSEIARFILCVYQGFFWQQYRKKIQKNEKKQNSQINIFISFQLNVFILSFRSSCFETFTTRLLSGKMFIYVIFKRIQILWQFLPIYFWSSYPFFRNPCTRWQWQRQPCYRWSTGLDEYRNFTLWVCTCSEVTGCSTAAHKNVLTLSAAENS